MERGFHFLPQRPEPVRLTLRLGPQWRTGDVGSRRALFHPRRINGNLITLKRFMAMNIFDVSEVWFFSTSFQFYQFLIALPAILDNFSWSFSPKLEAL
jgi:hypothetical protein